MTLAALKDYLYSLLSVLFFSVLSPSKTHTILLFLI